MASSGTDDAGGRLHKDQGLRRQSQAHLLGMVPVIKAQGHDFRWFARGQKFDRRHREALFGLFQSLIWRRT